MRLRPERTDRIVGLEIDPAEQRGILERLGFEVSGDWDVTVPTWRARDVTREIDVIEEVARVVLDRVPHTMPLRRSVEGHLTKEQRLRRVIEDVLVGCGFTEAYTWSLVASDPDPAACACRPHERRPRDPAHDVARRSRRGGAVNVDAGNPGVALFELARVYLPSGEQLPEERWHVGGIVEGGFAAARGAVEALHAALHLDLRVTRRRARFSIRARRAKPPQAGSASCTRRSSRCVGCVRARRRHAPGADPRPDPVRRRDHLPAAAPGHRGRRRRTRGSTGVAWTPSLEAGAPELREARVFDVYSGPQVGAGRKSVAIHLSLQAPDRTLSDDEAAVVRGRIVLPSPSSSTRS